MGNPVLELSLIIGIAAVLALAGRLIKQPTIIAYLVTGILVGPLGLNLLHTTEFIEAFAHMGVAFLLFIVGLNLDVRVLKNIGKTASLIGIAGIIVVSLISFVISLKFGFSLVPALYLAVAFAFSSAVVVVKLLADRKELDTLHGRIALGILIVQDLVAAFILMIIPAFDSAGTSSVLWHFIKAILLISSVFIFSNFVFPGVFRIATKSQEILFLVGISWALLVSMLFDFFGFSLEIGALLAGIALASSQYNLEIRGKVSGLRDFFVVLFFVFFGSRFVGPITGDLILQAVIFSSFVLIGKPIIFMSFMKISGYKKRTNFHIGVSLAQISEFSLILILLGFTTGVLEQEVLSLAILTALITIAISSYGIYYIRPLYKVFAPILSIFDGTKAGLGFGDKNTNYDVYLFGYNRIGFTLLKSFKKYRKNFVIIDYNPDIINSLSMRGINCIYGDGNDIDFLQSLRLEKARLVISTIPHLESNLTILRNIKNRHTIFIPISHHIPDTRELYAAGADYVMMPHFLGGDFMAQMLSKDKFDKHLLHKEGAKHLSELNERSFEGHTHPSKEGHGE